MRNLFGKLSVILAALVLLFAAGFFTVSLVLKDAGLIGSLFKKPEIRQEVTEKTGIDKPAEMENATVVLLTYMRGERANIKVSARVNGAELPEVFYHEKEIVHMAEVQSLWLGLEAFAKYGAIGAAALLVFGFFLIERGKRRAVLSSGLFWACGIFGGVLAFMGIWALLDFSSFWTVFHFIIFPGSLFQYLSAGASVQAMNELSWVLDSDSIMVNLLTPIFPSLVLRCAICIFLEIAAITLIAVFVRFAWRKQGKPSPVADVVVVEHDENEPIPIEGPDLVLAHKLRNAPKSLREEILEKARNGEPLDDEPTIPVGGDVPGAPETTPVGGDDPGAPAEKPDDMSLTGHDIPAEQIAEEADPGLPPEEPHEL